MQGLEKTCTPGLAPFFVFSQTSYLRTTQKQVQVSVSNVCLDRTPGNPNSWSSHSSLCSHLIISHTRKFSLRPPWGEERAPPTMTHFLPISSGHFVKKKNKKNKTHTHTQTSAEVLSYPRHHHLESSSTINDGNVCF